jgi:hypothetical protein
LILTLSAERIIVRRATDRLADSRRRFYSYITKIATEKKVICHKCGFTIKRNSPFRSNHGGSAHRKYYHDDCFQALYHS